MWPTGSTRLIVNKLLCHTVQRGKSKFGKLQAKFASSRGGNGGEILTMRGEGIGGAILTMRGGNGGATLRCGGKGEATLKGGGTEEQH